MDEDIDKTQSEIFSYCSTLVDENLPVPVFPCPGCGNTIYRKDQWFQCPNCGGRSTAYGGFFPFQSLHDSSWDKTYGWADLCSQSDKRLQVLLAPKGQPND